ncbi:hypothetical protein [Mycolicibacterium fortuitum]|uniref:hypothetical protein n=1 Tax=Mycolicibacterium fortuitum TaxID=1766 RepID=UPI00149084B5|nr:hypothetical protein [Mycolicibacterium fortuitum]
MSDLTAELGEIGGEMVDELVDGIRAYCSEHPNPLLTTERHFFRELGQGLLGMRQEDLVTLCAAAITRIAYPKLAGAQSLGADGDRLRERLVSLANSWREPESDGRFKYAAGELLTVLQEELDR